MTDLHTAAKQALNEMRRLARLANVDHTENQGIVALEQVIALAEQPTLQEPTPDGVLFAVEEAIRNGDCPWQIEQAFDDYEAERKAHHGIKEQP